MHLHALHSPRRGRGYGSLDSTLEVMVLGTFPALVPADGGVLSFNPLWKPLSPDLAVVSGSTFG